MTYATEADLVLRFGADEIAQYSNTGLEGGVDNARVLQVLTDTDALINGYLASRYAIPLSTVPDILVGFACDIARYLLTRLPTDQMAERKKAAVRWLELVAKGDLSLGVDAEGQQPAESAGGAKAVGSPRTFSKERLGDFLNPQDWMTGGRRR